MLRPRSRRPSAEPPTELTERVLEARRLRGPREPQAASRGARRLLVSNKRHLAQRASLASRGRRRGLRGDARAAAERTCTPAAPRRAPAVSARSAIVLRGSGDRPDAGLGSAPRRRQTRGPDDPPAPAPRGKRPPGARSRLSRARAAGRHLSTHTNGTRLWYVSSKQYTHTVTHTRSTYGARVSPPESLRLTVCTEKRLR